MLDVATFPTAFITDFSLLCLLVAPSLGPPCILCGDHNSMPIERINKFKFVPFYYVFKIWSISLNFEYKFMGLVNRLFGPNM